MSVLLVPIFIGVNGLLKLIARKPIMVAYHTALL